MQLQMLSLALKAQQGHEVPINLPSSVSGHALLSTLMMPCQSITQVLLLGEFNSHCQEGAEMRGAGVHTQGDWQGLELFLDKTIFAI